MNKRFWVAEMFIGSNPVIPPTYWTGKVGCMDWVTGDIEDALRFETEADARQRLSTEHERVSSVFEVTEHEMSMNR